MAPSTRPDYRLNLDGLPQMNLSANRSQNGSSANSPSEQPAGSAMRYPLGSALGAASNQIGTTRTGAGSPSKEYGSRLFPKRAREIQAQEGLASQIWGPPPSGSGHSTPLRETIPESPSSDSFPDFDAGTGSNGAAQSAIGSNRRARAGTVPSRFPAAPSPSGMGNFSSLSRSGSLRSTPLQNAYASGMALAEQQALPGATSNAALLSRYRSGSTPQRSTMLGGGSPFGSSIFSSNWMAGRERASTLQSIRSSDAPSSPRESPADNDVRTLDYLGLVDGPQNRGSDSLSGQRGNAPLTVADMIAMNALAKSTANRFRSYSVNATESYAEGDDYDLDQYEQLLASGQLTPGNEASNVQAAAIHEAVRQHNLEVQAFANFASASRPRARTAGILDAPSSRTLRGFVPTPSRLDNSMSAAEMQLADGEDFTGLANAVQGMNIGGKSSLEGDTALETPTRSLWLGNIPSSTTVSSLNVIFSTFGPIEFARVLTHKSCGFVNFENIQSAINAKAQYNGKEIFPGAGPIRIGFAKEQSTSNTPGANGVYPSPSPDPFVSKTRAEPAAAIPSQGGNVNAETAAAALATPDLLMLKDEIFNILQQFGATQDDQSRIGAALDKAMAYNGYAAEISAIPESNHNRVHDAPRLREIRKRIDNNSCTNTEIESIAMEMLPEIAELSSDYLGNTVVQKLFEHCSEETKQSMLDEIAPHLAEIGVHKNGTWAAQKIIDVARTPQQISVIVEALRPHGVSLFLDQYGNYVIQCCLRFQAPNNDFIFDTMINQLWEVSQGRFGARAMRACLESHFATNDQKRLMAAAITLHSVQLATNSNGALLLTWFLDTCTFPRRRSVLAPRLIPHLVHLCTHKVAYLTVLKIINQRNESDARDKILRALFFDEQTLHSIISDQTCGATFIFKVLTTPFLDESMRPECVENVRNALLRLKAQPAQGYKRLMDEVGLAARHAATSEARSTSKARTGDAAQSYARSNYNMTPQRQMDMTDTQRSLGGDPPAYDPYQNMMTPQYTHSPGMVSPGMNVVNPQQYQQAMYNQQQHMARPPGFYNSANGNGSAQYGSASPGQPMMDPYRQNQAGVPPSMNGYQQQTYNNPMMGMNGYGQYGGPQYMTQGQMAGNGGKRALSCFTPRNREINTLLHYLTVPASKYRLIACCSRLLHVVLEAETRKRVLQMTITNIHIAD
ncbi:hypothetical protein AMS68_006349 [Peltaster fructicola]|uniref:PUM-HD domain-containing protein n=1 Tax=Peltaster fructicola TaxID=286661 RepID=A0A6H0Y1C1_9PEZI|nr:hypothetical protein AMS68_006349 [Peltaster fructicola]